MIFEGCSYRYLHAIKEFCDDNKRCVEIFRNHGVLVSEVKCPECNAMCVYSEARKQWRCYSKVQKQAKKAKEICNYTVSDRKGTFLQRSHLDEWKVLMFVHMFLDKSFSLVRAARHLEISIRTAVDFNVFCCEVTLKYLENQEAIGGQDIEVEIDETVVARRKFEKGRIVRTVWVFGGIERNGKKNLLFHF